MRTTSASEPLQNLLLLLGRANEDHDAFRITSACSQVGERLVLAGSI